MFSTSSRTSAAATRKPATKKRFARIKARRISDKDFYAWSEQAREMKKKCDSGDITLEEYEKWLKNS